MMKPRNALLPALAVVLTSAAALAAAEREDVKDPAALRALWANKTHKGTDWMGRPVVAHYRDDGLALLLHKGARISARWYVQGTDQVCVEWAHRDRYSAQRYRSKTGVYQLTDVNTDFNALYSIEAGIPKF